MMLYDPELAEIIKSESVVEITGKRFIIEPNKRGSCDGCYWESVPCPSQARRLCCSNGGNILKEAEPKKK
jgi:hypothetical protein